MQHRVGAFDVWVYSKHEGVVRYLLVRTSQEKADRWFNGGRFWQIPSDFTGEAESLVEACTRCLSSYGIAARELWAVEHTYTIYNRRYEELQTIVVLAASVAEAPAVRLTWEHSEHRWCTAPECESLLRFSRLARRAHLGTSVRDRGARSFTGTVARMNVLPNMALNRTRNGMPALGQHFTLAQVRHAAIAG